MALDPTAYISVAAYLKDLVPQIKAAYPSFPYTDGTAFESVSDYANAIVQWLRTYGVDAHTGGFRPASAVRAIDLATQSVTQPAADLTGFSLVLIQSGVRRSAALSNVKAQ